MGKVLVFMGGVIAGAILGGAAALLLTPQSGESLRGQARQRYQDAREAGRKAADQRKQQLSIRESAFFFMASSLPLDDAVRLRGDGSLC